MVKPLYNTDHLRQMLGRDDLSARDKTALRFALLVIYNSKPQPTFPYWRTVKYADDGCYVYQCLNCKKFWEGRSEPGWFDPYEDCEADDEGAKKRCQNVDYTGPDCYYRKREYPLYKPSWAYCPHCAVKWEGPIRCNVDNERMLGPRRHRQQEAIYERSTRTSWAYWKPAKWWVVQERTYWNDRIEERQEKWQSKYKLSMEKVNAVRVHQLLVEERARIEQEYEPLFDTEQQVRVVIKTNEELEGTRGYCSLYEVHR